MRAIETEEKLLKQRIEILGGFVQKPAKGDRQYGMVAAVGKLDQLELDHLAKKRQ